MIFSATATAMQIEQITNKHIEQNNFDII